MTRHERNNRTNRRHIIGERRRFDEPQHSPGPINSRGANILEIWEEQKRIRAEEARLELEYERTKQRAKELKVQLRQRHGFLSDVEGLETTLYDDMVLSAQKSKLWSFKTFGRFKLRAEAWYLKLRYAVGLPVRARASYRKEKFALAAVLVAVIGWMIFSPNGNQLSDNNNVLSEIRSVPSRAVNDSTPEIDLLSPYGKDATKLPGFAKSSPNGSTPAYVYNDSVNGVALKVNQQELPQDLKDDPSKLETDNANRTLIVGETTAYMKDYKEGSQAVLFQKDGLLVLIVSEGTLSDEAWAEYITSLTI